MRADDMKAAGVDTVVEALMIQKLGAGPMNLTALRAEVDVPMSSASRLAWKLVSLGLVTQDFDGADRRARVYTLTERGRALLGRKK